MTLREAEDKVFKTTFHDGLWDILLGCIVLMFALAPLLSTTLGDFWSSMVFLPFWGLVMLAIWLLRKHVVAPRVGVVRLGRAHRQKLVRFNVVLVLLNLAALALGTVVALRSGARGSMVALVFGLLLLAGFTVAGYILGFRRLYLYGLLLWLAPIVGEWLYSTYGVPHHGFPITFGLTAAIMITTGLVIFGRLLRDNPLPPQPDPSQDE
jgi:hypothetical protein